MHVLLIHQAYSGPDDPGGTRHYELGRRLVAMGHRFTVVTSKYSYLTGEEKKEKGAVGGIDVRIAPTLGGLHRSYAHRILAFISFTISSRFTALRVVSPDIVLGTSPPMFQAIAAWKVAAMRRRPFVLEIRDLWPEFAVDLGLLRNGALISLARSWERFMYRRADHIIVNSPAYREYLLKKKIPDRKISVVPNGVDVCMFHPQDNGEAFRREHRLDGKFVVMYAGAVGFANDLDCLLRAADRLREYTDIVVAIVGGGKELPRLRRLIESMNLRNVRFISAQPKSLMPEVLAAADVCIATLKDIPMFRTTYPNKVFDYMAAGRPTLLAIDGAIRDVIETSAGGLFVPPGDDRALGDAILKLRTSSALRQTLGENARTYVTQHFDRDTQATQLADVLQRAVNP